MIGAYRLKGVARPCATRGSCGSVIRISCFVNGNRVYCIPCSRRHREALFRSRQYRYCTAGRNAAVCFRFCCDGMPGLRHICYAIAVAIQTPDCIHRDVCIFKRDLRQCCGRCVSLGIDLAIFLRRPANEHHVRFTLRCMRHAAAVCQSHFVSTQMLPCICRCIHASVGVVNKRMAFNIIRNFISIGIQCKYGFNRVVLLYIRKCITGLILCSRFVLLLKFCSINHNIINHIAIVWLICKGLI